MPKSIYLINPRVDAPSYYSAEIYTHLGLSPVAYTADLAIATVAALVPVDFEVTLCDEQIMPANLDCPADFVGLTGNSSQFGRMLELAQAFRQRGKIVVIGGPCVSLWPEEARPLCDILVRGEIEAIAPQLFADLSAGRWQAEYVGSHPDLTLSPIPRWDLYPNDKTLSGCIQTSRGCPFECEFCDVIQYAGRQQRHKSIEQVLAELDTLYQCGYYYVFIADDNFTAYRHRAKKLLTAIRDWNNRQPEGRLTFSAQLSIDAARDDELLRLCNEAGLYHAFIGLETPNQASLQEAKKRHNLGVNLVEQVQRFLDHGIAVMAGMIVGFDADGLDIFERQYQFAMAAPVPIFMLGALIAPYSTPLYDRLRQDNRLLEGLVGINTPWNTNIVPRQMSRETLFAGLRWLGNRLYHPAAFGQRVLRFIDNFKEPSPNMTRQMRKSNRRIDMEIMEVVQSVCRLGPEETRMFLEITAATTKKPMIQGLVIGMLLHYAQIRYMYQQGQFWEPRLAEQSTPKLPE